MDAATTRSGADRWLVAALVLAAGVVGAVHGGFTDLSVYRHGAEALLDGAPLYRYDDPVTGLSFTYPPFAAVLLVPLAVLPAWAVPALWTGASVGALTGAIAMVRRALGHPAAARQVALLTLGALALEPVWQNLVFGQVNLLLMAAVLVDLLGRDRRSSGVLVGLAAGVKLTPLVFVVLLVLVGRRTAAARAAVTFLATVAIGFAAMPASAATYWTHGVLHASRVGPPSLAHNQSLYGALTRLLDGPPSTLFWVAVAGPVAVAVLLVGALCWRRGDPVLGVGVAALAMLLASPVSWSHHWVWAVPVALALWERSRLVATAWVVVFVARPILWPPWGEHREYGWNALDHVVGNAYVLAALVVVCWVVVVTPARRSGPSGTAGGRGRVRGRPRARVEGHAGHGAVPPVRRP